MLYPYELIEVKPKLNKKKIFFVILIVLIIALSIYGGLEFTKQQYEKQMEIEQAQIEEEQRKQEEERLKEQVEQEARMAKMTNPFTEEQMQAVENIYQTQEEKRGEVKPPAPKRRLFYEASLKVGFINFF